jgi:hypothetical protein
MIHNANIYDFDCSPSDGTRIMTSVLLDKLKRSVRDFALALVQSGNWQDENKVTALLSTYNLRGVDIVNEYTMPFTQKQK